MDGRAGREATEQMREPQAWRFVPPSNIAIYSLRGRPCNCREGAVQHMGASRTATATRLRLRLKVLAGSRRKFSTVRGKPDIGFIGAGNGDSRRSLPRIPPLFFADALNGFDLRRHSSLPPSLPVSRSFLTYF